jgi:hypothetical protein
MRELSPKAVGRRGIEPPAEARNAVPNVRV